MTQAQAEPQEPARPTPMDALTLARLIGSRICHDIISPVGAIANGVELIELAGTAGSDEIALISDSVAGANARIRFYRVALGLASPEQMLGASEIGAILTDFYKDTRLDVSWRAEGDLRRDAAQAVFLALLCAGSALPSGGALTVTHAGDWQITGTGAPLRLHAPLWEMLTGAENPALQPSEVQFAMLPACTAALGRAPRYETGDGSVTIRF